MPVELDSCSQPPIGGGSWAVRSAVIDNARWIPEESGICNHRVPEICLRIWCLMLTLFHSAAMLARNSREPPLAHLLAPSDTPLHEPGGRRSSDPHLTLHGRSSWHLPLHCGLI